MVLWRIVRVCQKGNQTVRALGGMVDTGDLKSPSFGSVGSSPTARTTSIPVRPGDIGNTLYRRDRLHIRSERVVDGLQGSLLEVNVSEVIVHEGDEPDSVIDLLDSDPLTGEHG